jgi:hypothetical protein
MKKKGAKSCLGKKEKKDLSNLLLKNALPEDVVPLESLG